MMYAVKVLTLNEEIISDATVSLQQVLFDSDKKTRKTTGKFDQTIEAYRFKDCPAGRYRLIVSSDGYQTEELFVLITERGFSTVISLVTADSREKFIPLNGNKIPLDDGDYVRIPKEAFYELREELKKIDTSFSDGGSLKKGSKVRRDNREVQDTHVFNLSQLTKSKRKQVETLISSEDKLRADIKVIVNKKGDVGTVSNRIEVKFFNEIVEREREAFFGRPEIRLLRDFAAENELYLIAYSGEQDVFHYCQELLKSGLFHMAAPEVNFATETTAVQTPPDYLYPHMWQLPLAKIPEAWTLLKEKNAELTYGSADVIISVIDTGVPSIAIGGISNSTMDDFSGTVRGGKLSTLLGNNLKMHGFMDIRNQSSPGVLQEMVENNENAEPPGGPWNSHGVNCAGIVAASAGGQEGIEGNEGVVGIAPNARVVSTIWGGDSRTTNPAFVDAFIWLSGQSPMWHADDGNYSLSQVFPQNFNTPNRPGPGVSVFTNSYTWKTPLTGIGIRAVHEITSHGRDKRGALIFFASGNDCTLSNSDFRIARHEKVFTIAGSGIHHTGEEARATYSNWGDGLVAGPNLSGAPRRDLISGIDFCAPTGYATAYLGPSENIPPKSYGIITSEIQGTGTAPYTNMTQTTLLTDTLEYSGEVEITAPGGDFAVGKAVIINPNVPALAETRNIIDVSGNTIFFDYPLNRTHLAGTIIAAGPADAQTDFNGTSAACPHAAGIASLVISANPNLTFYEVRNVMQSTALPIDLRRVEPEFIWMDKDGNALVDENGQMVPALAPPSMALATNSDARDTTVVVNFVTGLNKGQAILFGAETVISSYLDIGDNMIPVNSTENFKADDVIIVGGDYSTHLYAWAAIGDLGIWVGNNVGFLLDEFITIGTGGNAETKQIVHLGPDGVVEFDGGPIPTGWGTQQFIILDSPLGLDHEKYTPVVLAKQESHVIHAIHDSPPRIEITGTLANEHFEGYMVPRVQVQTANAEIRIIKAIRTTDSLGNPLTNGSGDPVMELDIDPLIHVQTAGNPITAGRIPLYSNALGFGRLDAEAAVKAALEYDHSLRDLVVRNNLSDSGLSATNWNEVINSPDIWIRNATTIFSGTVPAENYPASYDIHGDTVHQKPVRDGNRVVFMRVGNIGSLDSFDYTLTGYASLVDTEVEMPIRKKDYFEGPIRPWLDPSSPTTQQKPYKISWGINGSQVIGRIESLHQYLTAPTQYLAPIGSGLNEWHQLLWKQEDMPSLPLSHASVMLMDKFVEGDTSIHVSDTRGYRVGQRILIRVPDTPDFASFASSTNSYSGVIERVDNKSLRLTSAAPAGLAVPAGSSVMRLGDVTTTISTAVSSGTSLEVADANHLMPGQYILIGNATNTTSEIIQIASISYTGGNDTITLTKAITEARTAGEEVSRVEGKLSTFILSEVTPHDGLLAGDTPYDNNNMTCKEVFLGHKISFLNSNGSTLIKSLLVDASEATSTINYKVRVEDSEDYTVEDLEITVYRLSTGGVMETVTFTNSGSWVKTGGAWCAIENPTVTSTSGAAAGPQSDVTFAGSFEVSNLHEDIRIAVSVPGTDFTTVETHKIVIEPVKNPIIEIFNEMKMSGTQRLHAFADMTKLKQSSSQAYGAINTNQYRVTSLFSTPGSGHPGTDVMAYAPLDSLVFMQKNTTNNTINLVLQPIRQSDVESVEVKYFIFRGLRKDDFIDSVDPLKIRVSSGRPNANLIDRLQSNFAALNPGADLTLEALNWDNKGALDSLDDFFFSPDSGEHVALVSRGMELGRFHNVTASDEFGFEIVLPEGVNLITVGDVQTASMIIDVSGMTDEYEIRLKREEIRRFMDPSAYYGMHFFNEVLYPHLPDPNPSTIDTDTISNGGIYTNIVSKFFTSNSLYIDICNEHGYSYNYDGTYTVQDFSPDDGYSIRFGLEENELTSRLYGHLNWPIMVVDNKDNPLISTINLSKAHLSLGWNINNSMPQLYVERGYLESDTLVNKFVGPADLLDAKTIHTIDEVSSTITADAALVGEISVGNYIGLYFNSLAESNKVYRVVAIALNAGDPSKTDIKVESGTLPTGVATSTNLGKIHFRKWTNNIAFVHPSVPVVSKPDQQLNVANLIKLRYFSRLSPNSRPIIAVNQPAKKFTVAGDVSALLSSNDYFIVKGSVPVGVDHNDGRYQINAASTAIEVVGGNTIITVNESIANGTANGAIYISAQSKVKIAHYTDNVFGPLSALNKTFEIDEIIKVSATVSEIKVLGDIKAVVELNETLNILESNVAGNNQSGLTITGTTLVSGKTVITISNDPDTIVANSTGVIQIIFSVWNSSVPTRWLAGFDKRFIDARYQPVDSTGSPVIGQSFVAQTGIAIDNYGVAFFATPIDFFDGPDAETSTDNINMNGGVSTKTSFWDEMQQQHQNLKLNMTTLKIGAAEIPVYDFLSYPKAEIQNSLKENFMALWITKEEITKLTVASNQYLSHLHDQYIVLRNEVSGTDDNGVAYKRFELNVNGWIKRGDHVVETEAAPEDPIYVYCHAEKALVFASENYVNLGELISLTSEDEEENLRTDTEAFNIFSASGTVLTMVTNFISTLNSITSDYVLIQSTVESFADQLWSLASMPNNVQDDRHFYWARLHMRTVIRNHNYLKSQLSRMYDMLQILEDRSRGISSIDFSGASAGAKKILLIAFDPCGLNEAQDASNNIRRSSPGAASALNLHGQTITDSGVDAYIQSVVLPVRYTSLAGKDLEAMVLPYLTGPDQVDMIVSVNDNRTGRYDVERFASRKRNPDKVDNNLLQGGDPVYKKAKRSSSSPLGYDLRNAHKHGRKKFLETTLPVSDIVPGTLGNNIVVYNQEYTTNIGADNQPTSAPGSGTVNVTGPTIISFPITGSSGDYIFNEVFFRIASIREDVDSLTKTGHISVEKLQGPSDDFNLTSTQGVNTNFTTILKDALSGL